MLRRNSKWKEINQLDSYQTFVSMKFRTTTLCIEKHIHKLYTKTKQRRNYSNPFSSIKLYTYRLVLNHRFNIYKKGFRWWRKYVAAFDKNCYYHYFSPIVLQEKKSFTYFHPSNRIKSIQHGYLLGYLIYHYLYQSILQLHLTKKNQLLHVH
jgi:hypothetical protein